MTRREFLSGMFSKEKAQDIYRSYTEFNNELNKKRLPTGDKELLKFAKKICSKKNYLSEKGGKI